MKRLRYQRGKWSLFAALALFVLLSASVGTAVAAESKGKVETSEPGFWATREGNRVDLSIGDDIYEFDILKTDDKGGGTIRFLDDTVLEIRNSSEIDVKEVVFTEERNRFNVGVVEGTARVITGAIVRQNPRGFKVTTPKSTIGIRGTDLEAGHVAETDTSTVSVNETDGTVTVTDKATGISVTGKTGMSVECDGKGGVSINGKSYDFNDPAQVGQAAKDLAGVAGVTDADGSKVDDGTTDSGSSGSDTDSDSDTDTGPSNNDCSNSNSAPSK